LLKEVTRGQPCEITGIEDYAHVERNGGIQWPLKDGDDDAQKERRLFEDGRFFTPDGRACFVFEAPRDPPETADDGFPFVLLTGRGSSAQWHTQSRTSKSAILRKLHPQDLLLDLHPQDAKKLRIRDGDQVRVSSRRASIAALARLTATVGRGQVFLPMHDAAVNKLTLWTVDPCSRQPSYKHCAVRVELSR
jgi:predicted molibdopterin-dependent oxidoreductase YjgC